MTQNAIISNSVTKEDYNDIKASGGRPMQILVPLLQPNMSIGLPVQPPFYWSRNRDFVLRGTVMYESLWASAVFIAISKAASLNWTVSGAPSLKVRKTKEMLLNAEDRKGWPSFLSKHLRDFLLTDNGAFVEIVRESRHEGSRVLGIMHLDSGRCTRTGDDEIPVVYRDKQGNEHEMKKHQVFSISDMPDSGESYYGVGLCAASRAYNAIYKLAALERYVSEKLSGQRPLALYIVNNITKEQLDSAIEQEKQLSLAQGLASYMGAVMIPAIDPSAKAEVAKIDLAGLPDGFDAKTERKHSTLVYADALGLDPQEIDPELLASSGMGTGSQSRVIDDKASGKGLVSWKSQFEHSINECVVPGDVSFFFMERDFRDEKLRAEVESLEIANAGAMVNGAFIKSLEGRQLLVDKKILPPEMMPNDLTPSTVMANNDKSPVTPIESPLTTPVVEQMINEQLVTPSLNQQMQQEQVMNPEAVGPVPNAGTSQNGQ